jgi:hypothetical protein
MKFELSVKQTVFWTDMNQNYRKDFTFEYLAENTKSYYIQL